MIYPACAPITRLIVQLKVDMHRFCIEESVTNDPQSNITYDHEAETEFTNVWGLPLCLYVIFIIPAYVLETCTLTFPLILQSFDKTPPTNLLENILKYEMMETENSIWDET